jgi:hypothetical protein
MAVIGCSGGLPSLAAGERRRHASRDETKLDSELTSGSASNRMRCRDSRLDMGRITDTSMSLSTCARVRQAPLGRFASARAGTSPGHRARSCDNISVVVGLFDLKRCATTELPPDSVGRRVVRLSTLDVAIVRYHRLAGSPLLWIPAALFAQPPCNCVLPVEHISLPLLRCSCVVPVVPVVPIVRTGTRRFRTVGRL